MNRDEAPEQRGRRKDPIQILLVEDNPGDVRLIEEALSEVPIPTELNTLDDGREGLAYVRQEGAFKEAERPDLVLLDLNLPRLTGHELLERVKQDPETEEIPVVVLTSSDSEDDLHESYRLQAAGFVTKPVEPRAFLETVQDLGLYWGDVVDLPDDD